MKRYERNRIVLDDLYLMYPHKTRDIHSKTVPFPYFPKDQITNNKYSLTAKEWKEVIHAYLRNMELYLHTGKKFKLGARMGNIQIRKAKHSGKSYVAYRETGIWKKMNNEHVKGYRPLLKWDVNKIDDCPLKFKRIWTIRFTKSPWKRLMAKIESNFSMINTFIDD